MKRILLVLTALAVTPACVGLDDQQTDDTNLADVEQGLNVYNLGVFGGPGGWVYYDSVATIGDCNLTKIEGWAGSYLDGIRTEFSCTNGARPYFQRGGVGGTHWSYPLFVNERIVGIDVYSGKYIDSIRFRTSLGRTSNYFGGSGGNWGTETIPPGYKLAGFGGGAGDYIDAIGMISYQP